MKSPVWKAVRWVALVIMVASTCWNFQDLILSFGRMPPRESDDIVVVERLFIPIRNAFWEERYNAGDIGYASVRSLKGDPFSARDNEHWARLRYASIPLNLVQNFKSVPYLIGDFTGGDPVPETIEGFVKLKDPGEGLVLYKRKADQ